MLTDLDGWFPAVIDVQVLTDTHPKSVSTTDGIEIHSVPSLLSQLREAIYSGMEKTGGSGSSSARIPIDPAALELYEQIDSQITNVWVSAFSKVPSADKPEALLRQWAAWAHEETAVLLSGRWVTASQAVTLWVTRISAFFEPPRLPEITEPCPSCGVRFVITVKEGAEVRASALNFRRSRSTGQTIGAQCDSCGSYWSTLSEGDRDRFAELLGIDVEAKKREHMEETAGRDS